VALQKHARRFKCRAVRLDLGWNDRRTHVWNSVGATTLERRVLSTWGRPREAQTDKVALSPQTV